MCREHNWATIKWNRYIETFKSIIFRWIIQWKIKRNWIGIQKNGFKNKKKWFKINIIESRLSSIIDITRLINDVGGITWRRVNHKIRKFKSM